MIIFQVVGVVAYAYIGWKSFVINKHTCKSGSTYIQSSTSVPLTSTSRPTTTSGLSTTGVSSSTTEFYCYPDKLLFATIGAGMYEDQTYKFRFWSCCILVCSLVMMILHHWIELPACAQGVNSLMCTCILYEVISHKSWVRCYLARKKFRGI